MSTTSALPVPYAPSQEALPSFEEWLRQKARILSIPGVIAIANLVLSLVSRFGGAQGTWAFLSDQTLLKSHILQALLIAVLILLVPPSFESESAKHSRFFQASEYFRFWWLFTLFAWLGLYIIFSAEAFPRIATWAQTPIMHVVEGAASCLSTLGFWKCFLTVSNPDQKGSPFKWILVVCLVIVTDGAARFTGNKGFDMAMNLSIGALSGIAMAFFIGRLESRLLRPPRWLLMALYCYAVLQFGYGFLDLDIKILWKPFFFIVVLLLKILLALFASWLIGTGNLLFYLRFMSELNHDYQERRNTFLQEVAERNPTTEMR